MAPTSSNSVNDPSSSSMHKPSSCYPSPHDYHQTKFHQLSIAVMKKWPLRQLDVNNAFLNALLIETVYMEQPPGYTDPQKSTHVCRFRKTLYGLKQAPRAWFHRFTTFLKSIGFTNSRADTSLFIFSRGPALIYLLLYVDDIIITGNNAPTIQNLVDKNNATFAVKDLGRLNYFLGLQVTYTSQGLVLSQKKYAQDLLVRANFHESKPISTPMIVGQHLSATGDSFDDPTLYRSLVGGLQYLTITRPDISYAVSTTYCKSIHALTKDLNFSQAPSFDIMAYSDADWGGCPDTYRSTSGYCIYLGPNLIMWSSKKQQSVSRSSCESEYRAMANAAADVIWVTLLLQELCIRISRTPTLLSDNRSALFITSNPVAHKRARHIALDYHFIQELVQQGHLLTQFIPGNYNVADLFTKSLPRPSFLLFRSKLRIGQVSPSSLRGGNSRIT